MIATESSEELFLAYLLVVLMFAIAVGFALRLVCNHIQRNAQNELYRTFYERHIQEYYRKVSSFFRRRQDVQTNERAVSRRVLNTDDFHKMNQRNTAARFQFEIPNEERPALNSIDPKLFRQPQRTPLNQMQDAVNCSRLYKTADFQNAPMKQRESCSSRNEIPFLRESGGVIPDIKQAPESFKVMGPIPEEQERSSFGNIEPEKMQEEVQKENKVPAALKMMRHSDLVTVRERLGLMYGQKNKID